VQKAFVEAARDAPFARMANASATTSVIPSANRLVSATLALNVAY
jgi:hypothetical protein